jgi:hypothetical protein
VYLRFHSTPLDFTRYALDFSPRVSKSGALLSILAFAGPIPVRDPSNLAFSTRNPLATARFQSAPLDFGFSPLKSASDFSISVHAAHFQSPRLVFRSRRHKSSRSGSFPARLDFKSGSEQSLWSMMESSAVQFGVPGSDDVSRSRFARWALS